MQKENMTQKLNVLQNLLIKQSQRPEKNFFASVYVSTTRMASKHQNNINPYTLYVFIHQT